LLLTSETNNIYVRFLEIYCNATFWNKNEASPNPWHFPLLIVFMRHWVSYQRLNPLLQYYTTHLDGEWWLLSDFHKFLYSEIHIKSVVLKSISVNNFNFTKFKCTTKQYMWKKGALSINENDQFFIGCSWIKMCQNSPLSEWIRLHSPSFHRVSTWIILWGKDF